MTISPNNTYIQKLKNAIAAVYVAKEAGKGLFSGNYNDLTNKPTNIHIGLTASAYDVKIDSTVTITAKVTNLTGAIVSGHTFNLTLPTGTTTSLTSNSNGIATYSYTCSEWGLKTFVAGNSNIQIKVGGWKVIQTLQDGTKIYGNS